MNESNTLTNAKIIQFNFEGIAKSWLDFIREENKISLCIEDKNEYKFAVDFNIKEGEKNLSIFLPDKIIDLFINEVTKLVSSKKNTQNKQDNQKDQNKEDKEQSITLEYTIALFLSKREEDKKENANGKTKICPFLFQTNTLVINNAEIEKIRNYLSNNQIEEIHKLLKEKINPVHIDLFSESSSVVLATYNISHFFNIDSEMIDSLIKNNEPPISILETALGINNNENLNLRPAERFFNMLNELKRKTKNNEDLTKIGLILFDFDNMQGTTRNIQKFIEDRIDDNNFYNNKLSNTTPIYNYLFGQIEETFNFDEYNTPSNAYWYGHATDFPLSKGQALVLQKLVEGENLIAVQGPPGTGKTTLLLNIIASSIVLRAFNIIQGTDFNNLILVTSTANKAVENAARDFKETYLDKLKFYSDFFLDLKKDKTSDNIDKINRFLDFLKKNEFSKKEYQQSIENIKKLYTILGKYQQLFFKYKELSENTHENLEKQLKQIKNEEFLFFDNLKKQENISKEKFLIIFEKLQNPFFQTLASMSDGKLSTFIGDINKLKRKIEKEKSITGKITKIFNKKDYFQEFYSKYEDIIASFKEDINKDNISIYAEIINNTAQEIKKLKEPLRTILQKKIYQKYKDIKTRKSKIEKEKSKFNSKQLQNEIQQIEKEINEITNQYNKENKEKINLFQINQENSFFDFYRTKLFSLNRLILQNSIILLKNYCLMVKEPLEKNLDLFKNYFSESSTGYKEIVNNLGNFYRYLSLAFPVMISTLHSSTRLFKGFDKPLLEKNINPIFISFIDEAGMANVYLPFPIITMSENVIAVGDPLQLPPVIPLSSHTIDGHHEKYPIFFQKLKPFTTIQEFKRMIDRKIHRFSPAITSVYHRSAKCSTGKYDDIGKAIFLNEHRRCQKPIANLFVKIANYPNMDVATSELKDEHLQKLSNFTKNKNIKLIFYDIEGKFVNGNKKTNQREALAIKLIIDKLKDKGYTEKEIGIITPFVDQEKYIREMLKLNGLKNINVGTVHKFQGQEFPVIIFSSVIFSQSQLGKIGFLNDKPNLLNVAISRAKHLFIMVGNLNILKKSGSYLEKLVQSFENNEHALTIYEGEILTEEENKAQQEIINKFEKKQEREILDTKKAILEFQQLLNETAKQSVQIIIPWIKEHTISYLQKSFEIANKRKIKINILYGYGDKQNEDETKEAVKLLKQYNNISLQNIKNGTHAKVLIVDNDIVYIGSLNWLSHKYYQYLDLDNHQILKLRNEMVIKFRATKDEIKNILNYVN